MQYISQNLFAIMNLNATSKDHFFFYNKIIEI